MLLKWGTLKGWNVPDGECYDLLKITLEGASMSCAMDKPDSERKESICKLIDAMNNVGATFSNDWSGQKYNAEQAKSYIMEYKK